MLSVVLLNAIMMSVIMLNGIMLSIIMLNAGVPDKCVQGQGKKVL
jgi:hypothetical protein